MVFTETHKEGYFDRLKKAIGGVVIGLVLFLASFWLLWWNEGNSLNTIASIDEFKDTYVAIPTDKVDPQNEKNRFIQQEKQLLTIFCKILFFLSV
ncbi:MAG: hypothetical protein KBC30_00670 [Planctomycetes bacterium]|nr:hypothetical protein [Planctomycetota bacterium]